jgi:hypothetical protein
MKELLELSLLINYERLSWYSEWIVKVTKERKKMVTVFANRRKGFSSRHKAGEYDVMTL